MNADNGVFLCRTAELERPRPLRVRCHDLLGGVVIANLSCSRMIISPIDLHNNLPYEQELD